jgi:SAM-dependent methyltransferase
LIRDKNQDAHGRLIYDYFKGRQLGVEIVERDDGFINSGAGGAYLSLYKDWPARERSAIRFAKGRVLDIGCGGGRHSLFLQKKGLDATGVDVSPLAVRVCKARGLRDARLMSIDNIGPSLGKFDTILMLGNNFGLFSNRNKARMLLRRLLTMTNPKARIIAESLDIYKRPVDPAHRRYHLLNMKRGRMPGQVKIRIRYRILATPWFDYLLVSKKEMKQILKGTGWKAKRFFSSRGPSYIALIERDQENSTKNHVD